eukprot:COSAG06_NODE_4303_length_4382_cov_1.437310_2_plen_160_part_00
MHSSHRREGLAIRLQAKSPGNFSRPDTHFPAPLRPSKSMASPALAALAALAVLLAPDPAVAQSVCGLATLQQIQDILPICCGSTAAPDCSAGFPPRCAPECAELLVPFWESCSTLMQLMCSDGLGVDVHAVSEPHRPPRNRRRSLEEQSCNHKQRPLVV